MRRRVDTTNLAIGMYVAELDRPWRGTPFLFQGFEIQSQEEIDQLRGLCQYVYVLTEPPEIKVKPVMRVPSARVRATVETSSNRSKIDIAQLVRARPIDRHRYRHEAPFEAELPRAARIEREAKATLQTILEDVRLGHSVDASGVREVVSQMVESVISNPDALAVLSQLKNAHEYTAEHGLRVCTLAIAFGRHLEMSPEELNLLGVGALLHDVGKMKVPVEILNKPAKLTDKEYAIMRTHVPEGVKILNSVHGIDPVSLEVVERHHERYGGGGYARGLSGEEIRPYGMIAAIVDCYDAISSDRVYHKGMSAHEALTNMYEWRGRDFHPGLVEQFIQCMGIYPIGSVVELSDGAIGVVITINRERRLLPKVAVAVNHEQRAVTRGLVLDLMEGVGEGMRAPVEIRRVLPPGSHDINPVEYLPVPRVAVG